MKKNIGFPGLLSVGVLTALAFGAIGCLPSLNDPDRGPLNHTFVVSDYFTPSGFMGDGAKEGFMSIEVNQNCKPRPPGAQGYCYHFRYYMDPNTTGYWGGVYWVFPANSWGARPGYAFDPTVFKQVHFYAAVETQGAITSMGGSPAAFNGIVGNIAAGNTVAYGPQCTAAQEAANATNCEYDDETTGETTVSLGTGPGDVTSDLQKFTIIPKDNGKGFVPTDLVGGFAWSLAFPTDSCTCTPAQAPNSTIQDCKAPAVLNCPIPVDIYIDDIVWDTTPLPAPADAGTPPPADAGTSPPADAGTQ